MAKANNADTYFGGTYAGSVPKVTEVGGLYYIHERIDQLVRQTALEVGLLRIFVGMDQCETRDQEALAMQLTQDRFWTAQDTASDNHNQEHREQ